MLMAIALMVQADDVARAQRCVAAIRSQPAVAKTACEAKPDDRAACRQVLTTGPSLAATFPIHTAAARTRIMAQIDGWLTQCVSPDREEPTKTLPQVNLWD